MTGSCDCTCCTGEADCTLQRHLFRHRNGQRTGKRVTREAEAVVYKNLDDEHSLTSWKWKKK